MKKITIVLPVYNEVDVIEQFNSSLQQTISTLKDKYTFEVIYVLDRSSDGTLEKLKGICDQYDNAKLISLSRRFGHQMSLVAGINHSDGDAVIMMDSDLEHPPKVIPELLQKFEEGYDVVQTIRIYNQQVSYFKKMFSKLFYRLLSTLSAVEIKESAADFRLISKKVVQVFQNEIKEQNLFLRGLFPWIGFNQTNVQFVSESRKAGKSKYNITRLFNFAALGIVSFSKKPLRFSIIFGLIISMLSIVFGFITVIQYFIDSEFPRGWTSVIVSVSFLGGIQLIFLGVIGEYIGGIFDEVKKRPAYLIDEVYLGVK